MSQLARLRKDGLNMSGVGSLCLSTENKDAPMCIDLVLPLHGDPLTLQEVQTLINDRLVEKNIRFKSYTRGKSFIETEIDISYHVKEVNVPSPGDDHAAMKLVSKITNEALDQDRPLWQAFLFNKADKTQILFIKMHHCIGDGVSLAFATFMMSDNPKIPRSSSTVKTIKKFDCFGLIPLFQMFFWLLIGLPLVLLKWLQVALLRAPPPELFAEAKKLKRNQEKKNVAWNAKDILVDDIKKIAPKINKRATFNDVLLSAVAGAFDRYARAHGIKVPRSEMVVSIPVNIRRTAPKSMGNKIGGYMVKLPVGDTDQIRRSRTIYGRTFAVKRLPEQYASFWMLHLLNYMPFKKQVFGLMGSKVDCVVTNVRGSAEPYYFLGRKVERLIGFIPPPIGVHAGIAISSLAGKVNITIKVDQAIIPRPSDFIDCIYEELEEMASLPSDDDKKKKDQ